MISSIKGLDTDTGQIPLMIPTCEDTCYNKRKLPLDESAFSFAHIDKRSGQFPPNIQWLIPSE